MVDNISSIQNKCYGCRSCEQICPRNCIEMKPSQEGFLYPKVEEKSCIHCGLCLKACPVTQTNVHRNQPQQIYAFKNKNAEEIRCSASGGAADVAAKVVLKQKGVVYGAAYDADFVVKHIEVTDEQGKRQLQSSKYVQSDINDCYLKAREALKKGKPVLFTGTPCQIAGLYTFLGGDDSNLFTLDLICHGVPSPELFKKYLAYQQRKLKGNIIHYNFRSKDKRGWGTQYMLEAKTESKIKTKAISLDHYGKHFMEGDCYRESCYQCPYANTNRVGDLTVGDFWGILQSRPEFYSEKGVSSVFINTDKGLKLFKSMEAYADVLQITLSEGLAKQGNLVNPTSKPKSRDEFYKNLNQSDFIDELKIGLQLEARIKAILPLGILNFIKRNWKR